ncbi:hypothetical protein GCM10027345_06580 [Hymenobacter daeguensis]
MAFSALAGAVLTFLSLRAVGRSGPAWQALGMGVLYSVITGLLLYYVPINSSVFSVGLGFGGGTLLNELFLKKQLPNQEEYPRRSIVAPLIICLAVAGGLFYLLLTSMQQTLEATHAA